MKYILSSIFTLLLIFIFSCKKENSSTDYDFSNKNGIFVVSEGVFNSGNASLFFYDKESGTVYDDIFFNTNGFPIGDIAQSMKIKDNKGYISVNNTGTIYVIDINTGKYIDVINGLTSPRYIEFISDTKAYVTDLYSSDITIINPQTNKITGSFFVGHSSTNDLGGTETIVKVGDYAYACGWSYNDKVYKIDTRIDKVVDSITVSKQPNSLVVDKNNNIWVLSDGGYTDTNNTKVEAGLTQISSATFEITKEFFFSDIKQYPSKLIIDNRGENLYFVTVGVLLTNGIYKMNISDATLPSTPFVSAAGRVFYALGIDSESGDIYTTDAIDHSQKGWLIRFDKTGKETDRKKVGINPGFLCFK